MSPETGARKGFFEPIEGTSLYRWNHEAFVASMSPASRRNHERWLMVFRLQQKVYRWCPWMRGPLLGMVSMFWTSLFEEGVVQTCKPRWGALTFSYLNDGNKPTLWHTWQQVMHPGGKYDGIWPGKEGAPSSKAVADAWEAKAQQRRASVLTGGTSEE